MLVPRPRINLVLYYGALAPRAAWRAGVVAAAGSEWSETAARVEAVGDEDTDSAGRRRRGYLWAELMRRTFGIDVLTCPHCGGRLRLLALIEHTSIVERILRHLGLPTDRPEPRPAGAPPQYAFDLDSQSIRSTALAVVCFADGFMRRPHDCSCDGRPRFAIIRPGEWD